MLILQKHKAMSVFTQIIILILVLSCMVMVLLAIRRLAHYQEFDDSLETNNLKEEIEEDGHILSHNNIFSNLVETEPVKLEDEKKTERKKR